MFIWLTNKNTCNVTDQYKSIDSLSVAKEWYGWRFYSVRMLSWLDTRVLTIYKHYSFSVAFQLDTWLCWQNYASMIHGDTSADHLVYALIVCGKGFWFWSQFDPQTVMGISSSILGLSFDPKNIHGRMCSHHHHMQSFYEKLSYRSVTGLGHPADLFQQLAALLKHALTFLGRSRPTGIRCRAFPGVVVLNMSAESTSWTAEENVRSRQR